MKERLPRKLKKKIKQFCEPTFITVDGKEMLRYVNYHNMTVSQRKWYYLGYINPKHKAFLIREIIRKDNLNKVQKPLSLYDNLSFGEYKGYGLKYLMSLPKGKKYLIEKIESGNLIVSDEVKTILNL